MRTFPSNMLQTDFLSFFYKYKNFFAILSQKKVLPLPKIKEY
ncbi:hypothetical protein D2M30_0325 [Bacillus amyloliquefaciens]|nr:hypothetical protein D2M30_0325 [Bacillus amyloliquefaciens]